MASRNSLLFCFFLLFNPDPHFASSRVVSLPLTNQERELIRVYQSERPLGQTKAPALVEYIASKIGSATNGEELERVFVLAVQNVEDRQDWRFLEKPLVDLFQDILTRKKAFSVPMTDWTEIRLLDTVTLLRHVDTPSARTFLQSLPQPVENWALRDGIKNQIRESLKIEKVRYWVDSVRTAAKRDLSEPRRKLGKDPGRDVL